MTASMFLFMLSFVLLLSSSFNVNLPYIDLGKLGAAFFVLAIIIGGFHL